MFRWAVYTMALICAMLQFRSFNKYRVERIRKHREAQTYLDSDVCADPITRASLGTFNLCESAEHIVNERPTESAFYDILNDWYPCGNGRCDGAGDWLYKNLPWFAVIFLVAGTMFYHKWVDHQRNLLWTRMQLPVALGNRPHVD